MYTICGKFAICTPFVLSMVGAIFAMVRCSDEAEEECLDIEGLDDRDELLAEDRISSMSSSESLIRLMGASSIATHCSTNVLNEMCFLPLGGGAGSPSIADSGGTNVLVPLAPVSGGNFGGFLSLTLVVRPPKMLVSDFVWSSIGRLPGLPISSTSLSLPKLLDSRIGDEGIGMVSISDNVRCLRIGFI
jgi:hypothetical protein